MDIIERCLRRKKTWARWSGGGLSIQTPVSSAAAPFNRPGLFSELDTWPALGPRIIKLVKETGKTEVCCLRR